MPEAMRRQLEQLHGAQAREPLPPGVGRAIAATRGAKH